MWIKTLSGMLLLIGGLLAVMPFGILVFAGPKSEKPLKKPKEAAGKEAGSAVVEAESEEVEVEEGGDESGSRAAVTDANLEVVDAASEEFAAAEDDSDFEVNTPEGGSEEDFFESDDTPKKSNKK